MLYDVRLKIDYDYAAPSDHSRTLFRLLPNDLFPGQRVWSRLLTIDPMPTERRDGVDFFGNATTSVMWHEPIGAYSVQLTAKIERQADAPVLDMAPDLEELARELAQTRDIGPASPHHFSAASRRAAPRPEMTEYAYATIGPGMSALGIVTAIGEALHRDMTFDSEATDVNTPAEDAFANRHGVCQDFTHIMIACLRGIGIPAGYVSGFLRTDPPPGQPRLEGADAMHAWVRAWTGSESGWVEYDPTNARFSGGDHITLGYGRDYDDVAPVRGSMRGMGKQRTKQAVDVVPVENGAQN